MDETSVSEDNKGSQKCSFPASSDLLKSFQMNREDEPRLADVIYFIRVAFMFPAVWGCPVRVLLYQQEFVKKAGC